MERCGKYELVKRIGIGGMSDVYLARAPDCTYVALKWAHEYVADNPDLAHILLDEARLLINMDHRNLCRVHEWGEAKGRSFIVMDYIAGQDLTDTCLRLGARDRKVPTWFAAYVTGQVAAALDYIHAMRDGLGKPLNIIHRDVSPRNILLGYDGKPTLIDFGIAKAAGRHVITNRGEVKGKTGYMSPEQTRGENIDQRSDIHSLGVVLYEMLTGKMPFRGKTDIDVMEAMAIGKYKAPRRVNRKIPKPLAAVVEQAMQPKASNRYPRAFDMMQDLRRYLVEHEPNTKQKRLAQLLEELFAEARQETLDMLANSSVAPPPPPRVAASVSRS